MRFFRKAPIFRILIPFILGVIPGLFLGKDFYFENIETLIYGSFALFILSATILKRVNQNLQGYFSLFLLIVSFFLLGVFQWHETRLSHQPNYFVSELANEYVALKVTNYIPADSSQKTSKFEASITGFTDSLGNFKDAVGNCLVYLNHEKESRKELKTGEILLIDKIPQPIPKKINPWGFDYPQFLARKNIDFQLFISTKNIITTKQEGFDLFSSIKQLRNEILQAVKPHFSSLENFGVFSALVLGQKSFLGDQIAGAYANAGTMHVLAVSGLHVGILYFVLSLLFKPLKQRKYWSIVGACAQIAIIWFYAVIAGLSPSIMRAATMFSCLIVADNLKRNSNIYNTLAISAFILLYIQPELLASVGFQLSYLAVLGIVIMYNPLYNVFHFKNRLANWAWGVTCVSIAAQLAVLPLSIFYFNQMPTYFVLANLLVIPMATINLCIGLATSIVAFWPKVLFIFGWLANKGIAIQNSIVDFISELPYSFFSGLIIEHWHLLFLYLFMIGLIGLLITQNKIWLKPTIAALLGLAILSIYFHWEDIHKKELVVFHHPKTIYVALKSGNENVVVAHGKRDAYFEAFELAPYLKKSVVDSSDVIQKDTITANFAYLNGIFYLPEYSIGVNKATNDSTVSLQIFNSGLENFKEIDFEHSIYVGELNNENFKGFSTQINGPFILDLPQNPYSTLKDLERGR